MNESVDILGDVRLKFQVDHPSLDVCWMEGYRFGQCEGSTEEQNPYQQGTPAHSFWEQGWWAGFYGEEPLFELENTSEIASTTHHAMADITTQDAANEPEWLNPSVRLWAGRVAKLAGAIAVTVAAIELLDMAV